MTKQNQNVFIVSAVLLASAALIYALSFIGYGEGAASEPTAAAKAPVPTPAAGIPAMPGNPAVQSNPSGLKYQDETVGTGAAANPDATVLVHYTGYLSNGTIFDSSRQRGQPVEFRLSQVVPGFREGIGSMKVGGKRRLIIPGNLAYGSQGRPPTIPPNATLTFDVELINLVK